LCHEESAFGDRRAIQAGQQVLQVLDLPALDELKGRDELIVALPDADQPACLDVIVHRLPRGVHQRSGFPRLDHAAKAPQFGKERLPRAKAGVRPTR